MRSPIRSPTPGSALRAAADRLGDDAAIVASAVICWTGWTPIDPLLSLPAALPILRSAWMPVRKSAHILLEPAGCADEGR